MKITFQDLKVPFLYMLGAAVLQVVAQVSGALPPWNWVLGGLSLLLFVVGTRKFITSITAKNKLPSQTQDPQDQM
ncbi:MAG: hypothetical protein WDZ93_02605 [Candidatus Paceibacterota bacterium]